MNRLGTLRERIHRLWGDVSRRIGPTVRLMEVCGTHTVAIGRSGLRDLLPAGLKLLSGPGCPVCVTDQSYIDQAVALARARPEVLLATYGDMVRVPGREGSLEHARADGASVEIVYAAHEALALAGRFPRREVVFLAVGFETTAPATALVVGRAVREGLKNFSVLVAHKVIPPAMEALLAQPDVRIDGFICPGHVSVIIGWRAYEALVRAHARPCVVAGFEDEQILAGIAEILRQIAAGSPTACSVYPPATAEGNPAARAILEEVFGVADARWRGLGLIPASGLELKQPYSALDARARFALAEVEAWEPPGCRCGDVLRGRCLPTDCALFGAACTPRQPVGACMVASEGACSAAYRYQRRRGGRP